MHDAAVVHRAIWHRIRMVRGAHDAVEVALHDAHALGVAVHPLHHQHARHRRHRDAGPERHALQPHGGEHRQHEKRDAELEVSRQHERRHDRDEHRAERAAERDHQVEAGEMRRIGLRVRELAVAEHAGDEEPDEIERRCDAQFYLGEWKLMQNQRADAIEPLRAATADECPKYLFEYVGAQVDLKRIAP